MIDRERHADPAWQTRRAAGSHDPVPDETRGAQEIGFDVPERYNASRILFDNLTTRADAIALAAMRSAVTYRELCAMASRVGNALRSLGLARGSRVADVDARHAGVRGGDLRRDARRVRAGARQHAVAGRAGRLLSCRTAAPRSRSSTRAAQAARSRRRAREPAASCRARGGAAQKRGPTALQCARVGAMDRSAIRRAAAGRHASRRDGDLDVQLGLDRAPERVVHLHHDIPYTFQSYGRQRAGHPRRRHRVLAAEDLLCLRLRQFADVPVLGRRDQRVACRAARIPKRCSRAIERHRPTMLFGLPTLYNALLSHPGLGTSRSCRACACACLRPKCCRKSCSANGGERYGLRIVEGLGSTEVLHIYLSNTRRRCKSRARAARACRVTKSGSPIWTATSCRAASRASCGCAATRRRRCTGTAPTRRARRCATAGSGRGDRFHEDADGFYYFEGRADDLIKVSGQWVHPLEIERCLAEHAAVQECAVLGVEDANRLMTRARVGGSARRSCRQRADDTQSCRHS